MDPDGYSFACCYKKQFEALYNLVVNVCKTMVHFVHICVAKGRLRPSRDWSPASRLPALHAFKSHVSSVGYQGS